MPQTPTPTYTRRYHGSESWLPRRVAARLVARDGFAVALHRAQRQKALHAKALQHGCRDDMTAFWVIFWDIVCIACAKAPDHDRPLARSAA